MAFENKSLDTYTQSIGIVTDSRGHEVHHLQLELQDHKDSTGYVLYTDATFNIVDRESGKSVSSYKIQSQGLFTRIQSGKNRDIIIPLAAQPELLRGIVNVVRNARVNQEAVKKYRDNIYTLHDEIALLRHQLEQAQLKLTEADIKVEQPKKAAKAPPKKKTVRETLNDPAGIETINVNTAVWPPAGFALPNTAAHINRGAGYTPTYWDPLPELEAEPNDPF